MHAVLLYNPVAGTDRHRRLAAVEAAATELERNGFHTTLVATTARGSGGQQARQAIAQGARAIFACGGDGTIHDVLQGVAGTDALFGIFPLGSANALARELGIPHNVLQAAREYRPDHSRMVALSVVTRPDASDRYFLSMAGAGPDGTLMHRMLTVDRGRWGRWLYYAHALRLFFSQNFPQFNVRYRDVAGGSWKQRTCVSAMAIRVGNLGGLFGGIARGASLEQAGMRLLLVHPPALLGLPLLFGFSWLGIARSNPWLTSCQADAVVLDAAGTPAHLQADGEWLGHGPAAIRLLSMTVRVLVPATSQGVSTHG